jgi:hypothetical protein
MTESEWLTCDDPVPMLDGIRSKSSDRKLIFFSLSVWTAHEIYDDEDWQAAISELSNSVLQGREPLGRLVCLFGAFSFSSPVTPVRWADIVTQRSTDPFPSKLIQATFLRCIFGNPFRPVAFDARWRTADVLGLARGIYEDRAFDRMPLLADALMDAGCDSDDILTHCRCDGPHVRGCWVVDLVLGKE